MRGLDGSHGVMIPVQNVMNLNLSDEVVEAVKNKKFHIYTVSTIEEGIEILKQKNYVKVNDTVVLSGGLHSNSGEYLATEATGTIMKIQ